MASVHVSYCGQPGLAPWRPATDTRTRSHTRRSSFFPKHERTSYSLNDGALRPSWWKPSPERESNTGFWAYYSPIARTVKEEPGADPKAERRSIEFPASTRAEVSSPWEPPPFLLTVESILLRRTNEIEHGALRPDCKIVVPK